MDAGRTNSNQESSPAPVVNVRQSDDDSPSSIASEILDDAMSDSIPVSVSTVPSFPDSDEFSLSDSDMSFSSLSTSFSFAVPERKSKQQIQNTDTPNGAEESHAHFAYSANKIEVRPRIHTDTAQQRIFEISADQMASPYGDVPEDFEDAVRLSTDVVDEILSEVREAFENIEQEDRSREYSVSEDDNFDDKQSSSTFSAKEYRVQNSNIRFRYRNSDVLKIVLPTLEDPVRPFNPKFRPRFRSPIRQAINNAVQRNKDHRRSIQQSKIPHRTTVSVNSHIVRIERATKSKSLQIKSRFKRDFSASDLTTPPEKSVPRIWSQKRPTQYPPLTLIVKNKNDFNARMKAAKNQYNQRSDDVWLKKLHKNEAALRQLHSKIPNNPTRTAILPVPPTEYNPWVQKIQLPRKAMNAYKKRLTLLREKNETAPRHLRVTEIRKLYRGSKIQV